VFDSDNCRLDYDDKCNDNVYCRWKFENKLGANIESSRQIRSPNYEYIDSSNCDEEVILPGILNTQTSQNSNGRQETREW
jgi:hypothetical protein